MKRKFCFFRRNLIKFIGLSSFFSHQTNAKEKLPVAPCSFTFDASHKDIFIRRIFTIDKQRNYRIVLYFYHNGGQKAVELNEILTANEALFTTESVRSGNPIRINSDDFMEEKNFSSIHEKNQALTKANNKYWNEVHKAISAKFDKQESKYLWLPQNIKGLIPVILELKKINDDGSLSTIISCQTIDAIGWDLAGGGYFEVPITSHILTSGMYEIYAGTVKDSPLFFDVKIELAITFRAKI